MTQIYQDNIFRRNENNTFCDDMQHISTWYSYDKRLAFGIPNKYSNSIYTAIRVGQGRNDNNICMTCSTFLHGTDMTRDWLLVFKINTLPISTAIRVGQGRNDDSIFMTWSTSLHGTVMTRDSSFKYSK